MPAAAVTEVDVYPTGNYPTDVLEVRAAVNGSTGPSGRTYPGGGVVRLKAANAAGDAMYFNFGGAYPSTDRGSVTVERDVTIVGESMLPTPMIFPFDPAPDAEYTPDRTVVYGGKRAFAGPITAPTPPNFTVRNVFFAYPSLAAIQVVKCSGLEVTDCVIYDVKPDATGLPGLTVASGIESTGVLAASKGQLFGDFRILNNRIRRASPAAFPLTSPFVDGGIIVNTSAMNAYVMANDIKRFCVGVAIDRNAGPATIVGNVIRDSGIGPQPNAAGIVLRGTTTPVSVERNSITGGFAGPMLPSKAGIMLASSNAVLRSNTLDGTFAGQAIGLTSFAFAGSAWFSTDNRVERNDLAESTGANAQVLLADGCDRNRFASNDYGSVGAGAAAGVVVPSSDNVFVNEDFWGTYTGTSGQPCIWLKPTSSGNAISAFKYQGAPQGFDVCNQVLDQGTNLVRGRERCT
jgi:hypothetical protein